jgi:hypothetical protein
MVEKVWDFTHFHGEIALEDVFQAIRCFFVARDAIPLLGSSAVVIVDTVQVVVLIVPAKCLQL